MPDRRRRAGRDYDGTRALEAPGSAERGPKVLGSRVRPMRGATRDLCATGDCGRSKPGPCIKRYLQECAQARARETATRSALRRTRLSKARLRRERRSACHLDGTRRKQQRERRQAAPVKRMHMRKARRTLTSRLTITDRGRCAEHACRRPVMRRLFGGGAAFRSRPARKMTHGSAVDSAFTGSLCRYIVVCRATVCSHA